LSLGDIEVILTTIFNNNIKQKTIKQAIRLEGRGLFTGEEVTLELLPAPINFGIRFQRTDVENAPTFNADLKAVQGTARCTIIGTSKATIQTVEHLLSAVHAYQIDNLLIRVDGPEVPVADGSALAFVQMIEKAGIQELSEEKESYALENPVYWTQEAVSLIALPDEHFRISYTLHYPNSEILKAQFFSFILNAKSYKEQIAPCRTFSLYEEIKPLLDNQMLRGGGLNNAVLIKDEKVMNPEGLRFQEEMARHKILDLIGDLSLIRKKFNAHIIAIRSGHSSNISFAKKLNDALKQVALV